MHEICQIAFEAHHAACKQSSGSKLGHTPQSKTIRDEEAFFLLKIIGMKEKNTEAYSAKNGPKKGVCEFCPVFWFVKTRV